MIFISIFSVQAHDYHISLAEVNWNSKSNRFEVALKVFTDDLEAALSELSGKKIRVLPTENINPEIAKYLKNNFWLELKKGEKTTGKFLGYEQEADVTWLYLEIPAGPVPETIKLHNSILLDQFQDQMNIVNLNYKNKTHSQIFKKDDVLKSYKF